MTMEAAFYHHTKATAAVAALVGTRIYRAGTAPSSLTSAQNYITYQRIITERVRHQGGVSSMARAMFQANCFSTSPTTAKAVADAVRATWETQSGATGEAGSTVTVKAASIDAEMHDFSPPTDASQKLWHRYVLDIIIRYAEP